MSPEGDRQERHFRKSQTSLVPVFQQEEAGENIAKFVNIVMITRRESDIRFHYHTMYIKSPLRHSFQQAEAGENIAKFVNIVMITRRDSDIRFHYHTMYIKSPLRHSPKKWCSFPLSDSVHSIHKIILVNRQCT